MNNLQKFTTQIRSRLVWLILINNLLFVADWLIMEEVFQLTGYWFFLGLLIVPILTLTLLP